jgi:hypothetical protein
VKRFPRPLSKKSWVDGSEAVSTVETPNGETVIDAGRCVFRTARCRGTAVDTGSSSNEVVDSCRRQSSSVTR